MYLLDNNFIIDVLANRKGYKEKYVDIIIYCLENNIGFICANQIDTLRYVIKKEYTDIYDEYLKLEKKLKIIKTPSCIDFYNELAIINIEDYLLELSASSINAKIITSDKRFLALSEIAIKPDDFYALELNASNAIDFANLKKQYFMYQPELEKAMDDVLNNASYIMGDAVRELETNLQEFTGAKHAITCGSGTDALLLAMMTIDIQPGDEIITTPFTFIATAETIAFLKAVPVFVDIDEETYNIDPSKIEEKITDKTKAIMPVSLYGQPADMDAIQAVRDKAEEKKKQSTSSFSPLPSPSKIYIIIDGAQSFGSTYKGKTDSNLGDISTTSFFPAKPLGCFGDGGAVFTNDEKLATKIQSLRVHGQSKRYHHQYIGMGGRMDTIQCAIVNVKLKYYEKDLALRQEVAEKYSEALRMKVEGRRTKDSDFEIILPFVDSKCTSAYAQYSIRVKPSPFSLLPSPSLRDEIQAKLKEQGIPTAVHYPMPLHLQECFAYLNHKKGDFPICEQVSDEIMSLPMNPYVTDEEIAYIGNEITLCK